MHRAMIAALAAPLLAGCPLNTEDILAWNLREAGLPGRVARCLADRVADRVSPDQDMQFRRIRGELARIRGATVEAVLPQLRPLVTPDVHILFEEAGRHCNGRT